MAMSYLARPTVVLDTGSGDVKAGFSGEDCPAVEFRPLVGRYRHSRTSVTVPGLGNHSSLVGETVHQYRSALSVTNVLEAANVPNYLNMEQILAHSFDLLDVDPSQHSVLLSDLGTVPAKEVTCQVMFETFQSPSLHLEHPAVLSLYGSGRCTGLVFLSGEGTTLLYPVYEGFTISKGVSRHSVTGGDLTEAAGLHHSHLEEEVVVTRPEDGRVQVPVAEEGVPSLLALLGHRLVANTDV